jgi:serine/threonine protein kinase
MPARRAGGSQRILSKRTGARYGHGVPVDRSLDRTMIARERRAARRLPTVLGMQLRHRVGVGGEGEVWAAMAPDNSLRAVKLIRPDVVAEPVAFTRRAQALACIDDPALVRVLNARVLGTGEWAGWGAMVMEFIDGEPLDDAHLGAAAFADLEPLALALDRLHDGVWSDGDPLVHRDVKPSNLIRSDDGRIVLVDPSTLRTVGGDMTYVGTPLFVAPEVLTGRFGPPADVYSFAATLLALHSGARGDALAAMLAQPDGLDVPAPVIDALSPDPEERPSQCAELVDSTRTVVARATADVAGPVPRGGPQTSRTWWRLGLLSAAMLPIITGLILPAPGMMVAGLAVLVGLLLIDPTLRDPSTAWLPLAIADWLVRTLETDDGERERVQAIVHAALLLPLVPPAAVVLGYGPRMVVLGTGGQLSGVATICGLAVTWGAVTTAVDGGGQVTPARAVLSPFWVVGTVAQAIARVVRAISDALAAHETAPAPPADAAGGAEAPDGPTR